jgi:uncharacterized Fe-S center protein
MDKQILLGLYPEYTSVLGPYHRSDGRQHIVLNNSKAAKGTKGKTKTISYPKALKEIELKQKLKDGETVDHHDRNFTNNSLNNLIVKTLPVHASEDAKRVKVDPVKCAGCEEIFTPSKNQITNYVSNRAGPFCSKKCSGSYGAKVQNGGVIIERTEIKKEYYRLEKK